VHRRQAKSFSEKGTAHIRRMILRDVAETVDMHESMTSRIATNRCVPGRQAHWERKGFFNSSIRRVAEEDIASGSVKHAIKKISTRRTAQPRQRPSHRPQRKE
jgi:RNA polymerase sigma-54 factor